MAPRSDLSLDSAIEFKPRLGLWASFDAWSQPKLQEGQPFQRRRRRNVRFARTLDKQTIEHTHLSDYTPEEKQACFFQRDDYKRMRVHNNDTVDKMIHRMPLQENEECVTGLEARTPRDNMLCHQSIRQALFAVLDEQDDQWRFDGCLNDDILASRYMTYTYDAKDRACTRALWLGQAPQAAVA
jgi:hypothetical protein